MPTTLLAIDDSATMRKVLEITFAGEDFRVVTADGPEAAMAKLRSERPAIVLADVSLDGTDGYALCTRIKAESPGTPVVLLASRQRPYDAARGGSAGADDFAEKPFDTQMLIDKVRRALGAHAGAQPVAAQSPAAARFGQPAKPAATAPMGIPAPAPVGIAMAPRPNLTQPSIQHAPPAAGLTPVPRVVDPRNNTLTFGPSGSSRPSPPHMTAVTGAVPNAPVVPTQGGAMAPNPSAPRTTAFGAPVQRVAPTPVSGVPAQVAAVQTSAQSAMATKLAGLGLTDAQAQAVLALSREVVERVVWEVVPVLAEALIKEEIARLTKE